MIPLVSVGSGQHLDILRERVESLLVQAHAQEIPLDFWVKQAGEYTFWVWYIEEKNTGAKSKPSRKNCEKYLKNRTAELTVRLIIDSWEKQLIGNIIRNNYCFNRQEQEAIYERTRDILESRVPESLFDRRENIRNTVAAYLEANDLLVIEGFVNFRLRAYQNELEKAVERAVDAFLTEREHKEFIRLLKYFVDTQEPRIEQLHVMLPASGTFQLYDARENIISRNHLDGFMVDVANSEINYEDLLISALVTIAPKKIILHVPHPKLVQSICKTLENIFGRRLVICAGCMKCNSWQEKL